jgi:hypothetical protein
VMMKCSSRGSAGYASGPAAGMTRRGMRSTSKASCQPYQAIGQATDTTEGYQNRAQAFVALPDMDQVAQLQALQTVYPTMLRRAKHRS